MSAGTSRAAGATEIEFAPAVADDVKIEPGIGYLQLAGLVVHTGWSFPPRGERVLRQHPAYEGGSIQPWTISTPDGIVAARFPYLTRPDAEAAAARIVTVLPDGVWPADGDTAALLPLLREASSGPDLLPLAHKGKPNWGSGYGGDVADFYLPDTRAEYEAMIAAHGRLPKACECCARLVREQKKNGWLPRTNHWPVWQVHARRPGDLVSPHCYCTACMRVDVRMGTFGTVVDDEGNSQIGSVAVYPWSDPANITGRTVQRSDRAIAWFAHFLSEGGCVVIDERPGVGLWPEGVQHDDALLCETGIGGLIDADPVDDAD
ncbi:hypothetical protein [Streptomyces sp. NPDC051636]|uniref:hypothetical protein n=1 Tax=Streptomyces sp. NPDC051636 TaxID=3365663 RepID=UPI00379A283F